MVELKANTTDATVEKHVPVVQKDGNLVEVSVGSVTHPMEEKHYIEWIALETKSTSFLKSLKPGDEPKALFALTDGDDVVRAYASSNMGCGMLISSAIANFFEHEDMAIFLEDDCVHDESFFMYCS